MAPEMEKSFGVQQASSAGKSPGGGVSMAKPTPTSVFMMVQITLRILAMFSTLIAISLIVTDKQTITVFTIQFKARYKYSSAFRFLVGTNAVVCVFSGLSLVFLYLMRRSESSDSKLKMINKYFFLFLHDTVILVLAVSGCAAATAIGYVGRHGEPHMTWEAVCDEVPKFCNRMFLGGVFSYLPFFAYFALTLTSARRLITISFPPPTP